MATIIFDEQTRTFSVMDKLSEFGGKAKDKVTELGSTAVDKLGGAKQAGITAGAAGAGALVGGIAASKLAHKAAVKRGLEPGTSEYKKFVRRRAAAGSIGTAALTGVGAHLIQNKLGK